MRRLLPVLAAAGPLALAACGGSGASTATKPHVRLSVEAPGDGAVVRGGSVELSGRVTPANATVLVRGRAATVVAGVFSAQVPVDAGSNVIDVMASAPAAAPAMTAVRVVRELSVRVPEVTGASPADARDRLGAVGLGAEFHAEGGPLDDLLPLNTSVCDSTPSAGTRVGRGATVRLGTAKIC